MDMLNVKNLSPDNLSKIYSVLKTILEATKIAKNDKGLFLIPRNNFEKEGIQISEVEGILDKVSKEESHVISFLFHEIPYLPKEPGSLTDASLDYFRESPAQRKENYERDKKIHEEKYSKNMEVRIENLGKFQKLLERVELANNENVVFTAGGNEKKVKFNSENNTVIYKDRRHTFHKKRVEEAVRLSLFKKLWEKKCYITKGQVKIKGNIIPAGLLATQLNIAMDASNYDRNKRIKGKLLGLIKNMNRVFRDKKIPIKISRKGGVQLIVEE